MKKSCLLLPILLLSARLLFAQYTDLPGFIDHYKHRKEFTFAYLSKDLCQIAARKDMGIKDWQKLRNMVENIGALRILAGDSISEAPSLYQQALNLVPTNEFDELLTVHDGVDNVRFWGKSDDKTLTDLILLVGTEEEFALILFSGALELRHIDDLMSLFDASNAAQLARSANSQAVGFDISPNPAKGAVVLRYQDAEDAPESLSVFNQDGRLVASMQLSDAAEQQVRLNNLPSGTFWLHLRTKQGKAGIKQIQIVNE